MKPGLPPALVTPLGALFRGDCIELLAHLHDESVDGVFAVPAQGLLTF